MTETLSCICTLGIRRGNSNSAMPVIISKVILTMVRNGSIGKWDGKRPPKDNLQELQLSGDPNTYSCSTSALTSANQRESKGKFYPPISLLPFSPREGQLSRPFSDLLTPPTWLSCGSLLDGSLTSLTSLSKVISCLFSLSLSARVKTNSNRSLLVI